MSDLIDMTQVLLDHEGKPMRGQFANDDGIVPSLTLGDACATALHLSTQQQQGKPPVDPGQKFARAILAERIRHDPAACLSAKEVVAIRDAVGEIYSGMVVMRVFPIIDPNYQRPELK